MANPLRLEILLAGIDKLSGVLDTITGGSKKLAAAMAATRKEVTDLQRTQGQVGGYKAAETRLRANSDALDEARTKTAALRAEIAGSAAPTDAMARALARAEREEKKLNDRHEEHARELQRLRTRLEGAGVDVDQLAREERRLADATADANRRLREQQERLERIERIRRRTEAIGRTGDQLRSGGASAATAGVATLAALALPTKSAAEFESQLTDIGQKATLTRDAMAAMGKRFDALGPKVAQLPSKLAEGVDTLAGLGLDPRQGEKMIAPIARAATAYKAEVVDLASATFASIDNLKVPVASTAKTLDVMAAAGKAGAFEIKDMAQYFPALTASAQALGHTGVAAVGDLAAALQITRKGAGNSESAANNLQNLLNKINTEDTIKNFQQFGIDVPAAMKKAAADGRSPIEAIAELTAKATGGDMSKLSFLFGDAQVQAALRPLISNMALYRKIRTDALTANGTVEADFADRMGDAASKAERLKAIVQRLGHQMGGTLLPYVTALMDRVSGLGERFGAWAQRNPELAATLAKVAATTGVLLLTFGALSMAIGALLWVFGPLYGIIARNALVIMKLLTPVKMLGNAIIWLAKGIFRAGLMMMANPMIAAIVLIVAAVALLAYAVYTNWDKIKASLAAGVAYAAQKWAEFKAQFSAVIGFLTGMGARFLAAGRNLIEGLINGVMGKAAALKNRIVGLAKDVTGWFKNALGIRSPSRVFMGLGGFLTQGLAIGVDKGADGPLARIKALAGRMGAALALGAAVPSLAMSPGTKFVGGETARPRAAAASHAIGASAARAPVVINATFTINAGSGGDVRDIEAAVRRALADAQRTAAAAARSSYADDA